MVATGLLVANCGSDPKRAGIDGKYGVRPSPKVVADGDPVPKGGGVDKTGKPYVVAGRLYVPKEEPGYSAVGLASWYGTAFHGRQTANGEVFDSGSISVAHPTMPLPSYVRVTNTLNGRSMIARVNDRGPYHANRLVDVSERVAHALNFRHLGTARVRVDYIGRAPLEGDDTAVLVASLRTDGSPAELRGGAPVMVASAAPVSPVVRSVQPTRNEDAGEADYLRALLSGRPMPGMPVPPDRPYAIGAVGLSPISSRVVPTASSFAPPVQPAPAVSAAPVMRSGVPDAAVPLPPVRPTEAASARPITMTMNAVGPASGAFTPPLRGRVGL